MGNVTNRSTTKAHAGQTIQQDVALDKSSYGHDGIQERPMGGSIDNLSHSLKGGGGAMQERDGEGKRSKINPGP